MRWSGRLSVAILIGVGGVAACAPPEQAGWRGENVHLVDGTWIGTEARCGDGDGYPHEECRAVLELALEAIPSDLRSEVTATSLADLPTTFVTSSGQVRTARLSAGLMTRKAVVLDLADGGRRVIGLWCHLPYYSGSTAVLARSEATCAVAPLEFWLAGNEPPEEPQVRQ